MLEDWKYYALCDLLQYEQPNKFIVSNTDYDTNGTPVLTPGKSFILGYTHDTKGIYDNLPVILFDDFLTVNRYVDFKFKIKSSAIKLLTLKNKENNLKVISELMKMISFKVSDHQRHWISQYSKLKIKLPTVNEQKIIANYLSNVDNLINNFEKLIEKKKLIKQGVMQELLTSKKRLPGFNKEWSLESNIFKFVKGKQVSHQELDGFGKYKMYNGGISFSGLYPDYNYEDKIIISEGGNSCGFVNYIKTKFWAGGHCYVIISCDLDKEFLYQLLKFNQNKIMSLRVGSGLPNIQAKNLSKMNFYFPTSKQEQIEIGKILTDMDEEINSLEQDLEKYKNIKQGMMEQLLTGKFRVV